MADGSVVVTCGKTKRDSTVYYVVMRHSEDGGATWSDEAVLRTSAAAVFIPGWMLRHSSGRLIVPVYGGGGGFLFCEPDDDWTDPAEWQWFAQATAYSCGRAIAELGNGDLLTSERKSGGFQVMSRWSVSAAAPHFVLLSGPTAQDDRSGVDRAYQSGQDNAFLLRDGRRIYYFGSGSHGSTTGTGRRRTYDCQTFDLSGNYRGVHPQSPLFFNPGSLMEYPAGCRVGNDLLVAAPMRSWFYFLIKRNWFVLDRQVPQITLFGAG
jgi:hypothetical protein